MFHALLLVAVILVVSFRICQLVWYLGRSVGRVLSRALIAAALLLRRLVA
jgi:hypothetical protein